ncbi:hypothetical protein GGF32_005533 [Allomyces javanicus]|nr:hypothetical protein GGF32_005533 [Allomyces javanicus]
MTMDGSLPSIVRTGWVGQQGDAPLDIPNVLQRVCDTFRYNVDAIELPSPPPPAAAAAVAPPPPPVPDALATPPTREPDPVSLAQAEDEIAHTKLRVAVADAEMADATARAAQAAAAAARAAVEIAKAEADKARAKVKAARARARLERARSVQEALVRLGKRRTPDGGGKEMGAGKRQRAGREGTVE